jgi:hypothetical protein
MSKKLSADSKTEMRQVCLRVKKVLENDSMEVMYSEPTPEINASDCGIETESGSGKGNEFETAMTDEDCLDLDSLESNVYLHSSNLVESSDTEMGEIQTQIKTMTIEDTPEPQHHVTYLIRYHIPNLNPPNCSSPLPVDKYLILSDLNCLSFPISQEELEQEEGFKYKKSIRRKCRELNISLSKIEKISHLETIESEHVCNHVYICDLNQLPRQTFPNILSTPASLQQPCWKDYYHLNLKSAGPPPLRLKTLDSQHIDLSVL